MNDKFKLLTIVFLDSGRRFSNRITPEKDYFCRNYGLKMNEKEFVNCCKILVSNGFLSDLPSDIVDKIRVDKIRVDNIANLKIQNLLISFSNKDLVEKYLEQNALKNKSHTLSPNRRLTLLIELKNCKERCNNDSLFGYAIEGAIKYQACNIGYVNAIIKNQKTKAVEK
jgi:hypothetical protein